jgi:hypothetical protein
MTETAKTKTGAAEAPLTWTSKSEWGSVGNTHRASIELDNGDRWSFVVDQPRKGYWTARGWRADAGTTGSGDMVFYREDRTLKGAKAQTQAHANLAATSTCDECRKVAGHKLDCSTGRALDAERTRGQRVTLRAVDEGALVLGGLADGLKRMGESAKRASAALATTLRPINAGLWRMRRPCSCPTPTHRMSCGQGARPAVISK